MKKLLALVLAMVMTLGLATIGANATFTDQDAVDASKYDEAITVLNGMKVFKGDDFGNFNPEKSITRAEVAAIIYRIYTGDVTDAKIDDYKDLARFDDLKYDWYKGYIGYCYNAGFIKGYSATKFGPDDPVTGYQALTMILRAVGYDKNHEFEGVGYSVEVARVAQQLGLLDAVAAETLANPARREVVAQILFDAVQVPTVTYTLAFGYSKWEDPVNATILNPSLGWKNFGLMWFAGGSDKWGRPLYTWGDGRVATSDKAAYATFKYDATVEYTTPVAECDVAHDLDRSAITTFESVVNAEPVENYNIRPLATNVYIGGQGRLTQIYDIPASETPNNVAIRRIVMIDTFLAKVTKVAAPTYDRGNHRVTDALMTLEVYVQGNPGYAAGNPGYVTHIANNGGDPWTYAVGDYILINAKTDSTKDQVGNTAAGNAGASVYVTPRPAGAAGSSVLNQAGSAGDFAVNVSNQFTQIDVLGVAESFVGAQTVLHYNNNKHTIGGVEYDDALEFHVDPAMRNITNYTWFKDQYGNLIGDAVIANQYTYGVITRIWWVPDATDGGGYASANVTYMDGTTGTIKLGTINYYHWKTGVVAGGTDTAASQTGNVTPVRAVVGYTHEMQWNGIADGTIPVSTFYWANETADTNYDAIIGNHLFRFNEGSNGYVAAVEVGTTPANDAIAGIVTGKETTAFTRGQTKNGNVMTNTNTVFLIKSGSTYTSVTGFRNLPSSYYGTQEVDWVNTNTDQFAEYVFLRGTAASNAANARFYLTSPVYTWNLNAAGTAIENYYLTGYLNGESATITVPANLTGGGNGSGTTLVGEIVNAYSTNPGSAWVLWMSDKTVLATPGGQRYTAAIDDNTDNYTIGTDTEIIKIVGATGDNNVGGVYTDSSAAAYFTGTDTIKPLVGEWAEDMSSKNVVLVYSPSTRAIKEAYIYDVVTGLPSGSGVVPVTARTDTVTWTVKTVAGGVETTVGTVSKSVTADTNTSYVVYAMNIADAAVASFFPSGGYTIQGASFSGSPTYTVTGGGSTTATVWITR